MLDKKKKKAITVTFRVTETEYKKMKTAAKSYGMTPSGFFRACIGWANHKIEPKEK